VKRDEMRSRVEWSEKWSRRIEERKE
jgi:hypothetical protein